MAEEEKRKMGAAGYLTVAIALGYVGFELYALQHSREQVEPQAIYARYVGARHAVQECAEPEDHSDDFERNFRVVSAQALRDLESNEATAPKDSAAALAGLRRTREAEVDALIAEQGCDGKELWRLLKFYEVRSRLTLRG
jgi:hypothetical protein